MTVYFCIYVLMYFYITTFIIFCMCVNEVDGTNLTVKHDCSAGQTKDLAAS